MWNLGGSATITNCVFNGNSSDWFGGGFCNMDGSPTLVNCTFSGNSADTDGSGGGMYCDSESTVTNCIFWGNTDNNDQNHDESAQIHTDSGTTVVNYSCIQGLDTFTGNGNIGDDPCFVDSNNPDGNDGIFGTLDDGLRLTIDSNCIDAADGNAAPATDILGHGRIEVYNVDNNGIGEPNYADMGAYEFGDGGIVVMVWIDESTEAYHKSGGDVTFETDLAAYRELLNSGDLSIVQSGCLVPLPSKQFGTDGLITDVLPDGCSPPKEIRIEPCGRFPDEDEKVAQFNRIRAGVPDYLLLSVDNSNSMNLIDIWEDQADYDSFANKIKNLPGCSNIVIAPEPRWFRGEQWVAEMNAMLEETIGD